MKGMKSVTTNTTNEVSSPVLPFDDAHIDMLTEFASMGTAYAATALSSMIDKTVRVTALNASWVDFQNISDFIGGPDNVVAGIIASLSGDMQGMVIHLMELQSANMVLDVMLNRPPSEKTVLERADFSEMERSALNELGNIMLGSYINPLANMVNCKILLSPPSLALDMANAILAVPIIEFGMLSDKALLIQSELTIDNIDFSGCFTFTPNVDSFKQLLQSLKVV